MVKINFVPDGEFEDNEQEDISPSSQGIYINIQIMPELIDELAYKILERIEQRFLIHQYNFPKTTDGKV